MSLFDVLFWRQVAGVLVRTLIAGVTPFVPELIADPVTAAPKVLSVLGLLTVLTVATSLAGIVTPDTATWWQMLTSRGLRQFAQFLAAGLAGALIWSDVNWLLLLQGAAASAITTVLIAALTVIPGGDLQPDAVNVYVPQRAESVSPVPVGFAEADEIKAEQPEIEPDDADMLGPDDEAEPDPLRDGGGI